ncbi:retrovirus-related pol polyprotein from transposon TNT 1-94 [Tanacetum coccineum]
MPTLHTRPYSNAGRTGRTGRPLVSGLRLFKTHDGESSKLKNFMEKFIGTVRFIKKRMIILELSWLMRRLFLLVDSMNHQSKQCGRSWTQSFFCVGIFHQKSVPRTPQQNGVVERQNRTLVESARTMLIFSKAPMFLWAEVVATAFFPQGVAAGPTIEDTLITQAGLHPSVNPVVGEPGSAQSTSGDVSLAEPNQVNQPPDHLRK